MYGLVNKGLEDMVRGLAGDGAWARVKEQAGVGVDLFVSHQGYPDEVTVSLVVATAAELGTTPEEVLVQFGRFWVTNTANRYGHVLEATGRTFPEFLTNLPNLHTRLALSFPHLEPPKFRCEDVTASSLVLVYASKREGLLPFVRGLIEGLGVRFCVDVRVAPPVAADGGEHRFFVEWTPSAAAS